MIKRMLQQRKEKREKFENAKYLFAKANKQYQRVNDIIINARVSNDKKAYWLELLEKRHLNSQELIDLLDYYEINYNLVNNKKIKFNDYLK
jgi:hypothetical protein